MLKRRNSMLYSQWPLSQADLLLSLLVYTSTIYWCEIKVKYFQLEPLHLDQHTVQSTVFLLWRSTPTLCVRVALCCIFVVMHVSQTCRRAFKEDGRINASESHYYMFISHQLRRAGVENRGMLHKQFCCHSTIYSVLCE